MEPKNLKQIYTDGASNDEMGYGAWAVIIIDQNGKRQQYSGSIETEKSNVAELHAILIGLRQCQHNDSVIVHTDHESFVKIVNHESKTKLDQELWGKVFAEIQRINDVKFIHVSSSHSGVGLNADCHRLVTSVIKDRISHDRLALYESYAKSYPDLTISDVYNRVSKMVEQWVKYDYEATKVK